MLTYLRYTLATFCFAARDPLILIVAGATALVDLLSADPRILESQIATLFSGQLQLVFLAGVFIVGIPTAFWMPNMRAGRMGRQWQVPSATYLLPRTIVRIMLGAMFGQSAAYLVCALRYDSRLYWDFGSSVLISSAFCVGAWKRLRRHPGLEFNMPWWRTFIAPWRNMFPTRLGDG
jgi:hypothetical protein